MTVIIIRCEQDEAFVRVTATSFLTEHFGNFILAYWVHGVCCITGGLRWQSVVVAS